ncbi:MAG TPA: DinB family protein, partial [Gemmatimonadales bacterium]|nr:DinB family protein [Gemmatimonadales bacterium]
EDLPPVLRTLTDQFWIGPGRSAPIGYHVAHLAGSLDRLFTYARGEGLSPEQQLALAAERTITETRPQPPELLALLTGRLDGAVRELASVPEASLLAPREVGRARLPSTTLGLLFHAAEHTARHAGQILTLTRVVRGEP